MKVLHQDQRKDIKPRLSFRIHQEYNHLFLNHQWMVKSGYSLTIAPTSLAPILPRGPFEKKNPLEPLPEFGSYGTSSRRANITSSVKKMKRFYAWIWLRIGVRAGQALQEREFMNPSSRILTLPTCTDTS
jgi:hypothetical protein